MGTGEKVIVRVRESERDTVCVCVCCACVVLCVCFVCVCLCLAATSGGILAAEEKGVKPQARVTRGSSKALSGQQTGSHTRVSGCGAGDEALAFVSYWWQRGTADARATRGNVHGCCVFAT